MQCECPKCESEIVQLKREMYQLRKEINELKPKPINNCVKCKEEEALKKPLKI